jgi:hypothetical protein
LAASILLSSTASIALAQAVATVPARPTLTAPASLINPDWNSLSTEQKRLLEPLAAEWSSLEPANRVRWIELTARHHSMPSEEQRLLEERIASWARLSPIERQQARQSFKQVLQAKPQDLEAKWEAYQALPPEQREALAGKAAQKRQPTTTSAAGVAPTSAAVVSPPERKPGAALIPMPLPTTSRQPQGTALLQAKPGVTTVLITQRPAPAASKIRRQFFDAKQLDNKTLLPKVPVAPVGGQS